MTKPKRPILVTFLAGVNLLFGLGALASVAATVLVNSDHFHKPPEVAQRSPTMPGSPPMPATRPLQTEPVHPLPDSDLFGIMKEQSKWYTRQIATYELFVILSIVAALVLAALYLGSGIGMMLLSPAGRRLAILAALIAPLVAVGTWYYYWTQMRPELQKWETNRNNQIEKIFQEPRPDDRSEKQTTYGVGIGVAVSVGYSLLLLACMFLPGAQAAFDWWKASAGQAVSRPT
jgi:hypothetical protein